MTYPIDSERVFSEALSSFRQRAATSVSWLFSRDAGAVVRPFVTSRLLIVALLALTPAVFTHGWFWVPGDLLAKLTQWDSSYYLHIARHGYFSSSVDRGTVGFFPLFPILVRLMSYVFHDYRVAAVVVANTCLLIAGFLLHRIVRIDFSDRRIADTTVAFLMFSPVSFFFSCAYSEATFLMFAVATFLAATRGSWFVAGLCGMCLAATRNVGFFMAVPVGLEYLRQNWDRQRPFAAFFKMRILGVALVPVGLILFMLYCYRAGDDAFAYTHASAGWGRRLVSPLRTIHSAATIPIFYRWLFLGTLAVGLCLWGAGLRMKIRGTYLVWAALLIATYLCSNSLEAMPRYLSVVFPLFIVLGIICVRYRWTRIPALAASVALLTLCTVLLAAGYWMT